MKFFLLPRPNHVNFSWNDASVNDWKIIRKFFVAAYVNAYAYLYKNCATDIDPLELEEPSKQKAQAMIDGALIEAIAKGISHVDKIFKPLEYYYRCDFSQEKAKLCACVKDEISPAALKPVFHSLKHLFALIDFFEKAFHGEKTTILNQKFGERRPIQYVIARLHDQPIGFISCELNPRSGHVYLRWNNMSPDFQHDGLGRRMMEKVIERYPEAVGIELYTRKLNKAAEDKGFYPKCDLSSVKNIFDNLPEFKPRQRVTKWLSTVGIFPPDDDLISAHHDTYVGFQGKLSERKEIETVTKPYNQFRML